MVKAAYVQGRLTKDEFDVRLHQTLMAKTLADLAALTHDLPAGLTDVPPPPPHQPSSVPVAKIVLSCAGGLLAPTVLAAAFLTSNSQLFALFILPTMITLMAWIVAGAVILDAQYQKRSRRPPGAGGSGGADGSGGSKGSGPGLGGPPAGRGLLCERRDDLRRPPAWRVLRAASG